MCSQKSFCASQEADDLEALLLSQSSLKHMCSQGSQSDFSIGDVMKRLRLRLADAISRMKGRCIIRQSAISDIVHSLDAAQRHVDQLAELA